MTNAPETRKTHVIRIFGTNRNGDVLQDMWADVERIDRSKSSMASADIPEAQWQGHQQKFRWCDDPNSDDYEENGNPSRKQELVKVCSPHSDNLEDPDEWIPIYRVKSMKSRSSHENFTGQQERIVNLEDNESRKFETRRIVHHGTNIDDAARAAADAGQKVFVVPGEEYTRDDSTKDENQYVEHEIVKSFKQGGNNVGKNRPGNQGRQVRLKNDYLIDESEPAQFTEVGPTGIDPPYRLDPYQNIINIKFKTLYLVVQIGGGNTASHAGPGAAPSAGPPGLSAMASNKNVKLLDTRSIPVSSAVGFAQCFTYGIASNPDRMWQISVGLITPDPDESVLYGGYPPTGNSCPITPSGSGVVPINFTASAGAAVDYLFAIPEGNNLVQINVGGLFPNSPDPTVRDQTSGQATIAASVYSTVRKRVKKLTDLITYEGGGGQKPTADDTYDAAVTSSQSGSFMVNVFLSKDPGEIQTDNYGNKFRPYKVKLTPDIGQDQPPSQPPPRLD